MKIYTKTGDDGTTGLFYGGRVSKDSVLPKAYGSVDEAQATIGVARASVEPGSEIDGLLVAICGDLYVAMAELATAPENRAKLTPGQSLVTVEMVDGLDVIIDDITGRFDAPTEFVIPGQNETAARLDLARTVVRRAERESLAAHVEGSQVIPYLNRLSDLVWTLARWQEGEAVEAKQSRSGS